MDNTIKEAADTVAKEGVGVVRDTIEHGKEAAKRYAHQAKEYGVRAKAATESTIRNYPFWSLLIALGVGIGVGLGLSAAIKKRA